MSSHYQEYSSASYDETAPRSLRTQRRSFAHSSIAPPVHQPAYIQQYDQYQNPYEDQNVYRSNSFPSASTSSATTDRVDSGVLDRMKRAGWATEADVGRSPNDARTEGQRLHPAGKASFDSGYEEGNESEQKSWGTALKKVVGWQQNDSGRLIPAQGTHLWENLTGKLTATVSAVNGHEDDDQIGEDGQTKLSRVIRDYHFSRATSRADLPDWILADFDKGSLLRSHSSPAEAFPAHPTTSHTYEERPRVRPAIYDEDDSASVQSSPPANPASSSGIATSRANDRLRAMREAKRNLR